MTQNNQPFTCTNCGRHVSPHPSSSRDHCNYCLYGKHVDIIPGDRKNSCKGLLEPVGLKVKNRKEQIVYTCLKCNETVNCITSPDDNREKA